MEHRIVGTTMPVLEMTIQPGESIIAESGELSWMSAAVQLQTSTKMATPQGGMFGRLKRVVGGGGLFMTEYSAQGGAGMVAFAAKLPGQIFPVEVGGDKGYMAHRHGFVCGTPGVEISVGFQQKLGAGIFGGEGFVLQKIAGNATVFVELSGEIVTYELGPSDTLRVHPGHVGLFEQSVSFTITTVPGIKNKIFGGDGLFLAALTGPGKVWLQSMTLSNLAHSLIPYLPETQGSSSSGGGAGGIIGGLLGN